MKVFSTCSRLVCFMAMVIFVAQSSTAIAGNPLREEGAQPAPGPAYVSALDAGVTIPEGVRVTSEDRAILSQITAEQYEALRAGTDPETMVARDGRMVDQVIGEVQGEGDRPTDPNAWRQQPKSFLKQADLNVDGTISPTDGECKQGMDISYDGQWGYHPLVVSLANTREPLYIVNRSGNAPSHLDSAR